MRREQRQVRALKALSVTGSKTEAAQMAGISRRTLYNYLHDPWFIHELEKLIDSGNIETYCVMEDMRTQAEDTLMELLGDPSPAIRIKAAKAIIDMANRREKSVEKIFERQTRKEEKDPLGVYDMIPMK